ncbi:hypothetical protein PoHVEF18_010757 [Penicillium ochrochloron]
MGQQYLLLWQNAPDKEATARLIRETVRLLQLTEANARAHPTSARAGTTPGTTDRAESDKKRALMKTINKIKDYNGKIQGDAAREHLYDCERYFQRRSHKLQATNGYGTAITTWQGYKDWINREFSEHLSAAKRWDRFKTLRQGPKQPFMEYATQLRQAAIKYEQAIPDPIFVEFLRDGAQTHLQRRWAEERNPPTNL